MPEQQRKSIQGITLLSDEDAVAISRGESRNTSKLTSTRSRLSGYYPSTFTSRTSCTIYGRERDSSNGEESFLIGSGNDNGALYPSQRLSVSPEVNHTFEDMFKTDWEGYIWKRGHVVRSWRHRFAVLSGTCLSYYTSKEVAMLNTEKYRGRVTVTAARNDETRSCGVLITTTINKTFIIYTRTPVERDIWVCMITQAVANLTGHIHSPITKSSTSQVRSSMDWETRNLSVVKQFYNTWTTVFSITKTNDLSSSFLSLVSLLSTDLILSVSYSAESSRLVTFYGREGLVDFVVDITKYVHFEDFTVTRYITTKHPNVLQVVGSGQMCNKSSNKVYAFALRDELQVSPGGRILSIRMQIDVDANALQNSDTFRLDRHQYASNSKRVLSLSIQHFHVNRILGKGTFGTVVLAARRNTGEIFAIKILEKDSMSNYDKLRTKTEMRILRDVHHPFIAPLRFSFQSQSRVFLGMEYYPGGSLYTHMNRFTNNKEHRIKIPLDLARVRFYVSQIVLALCHLHACEIVYRDLKPDNIMLDEDGNIALVDFGLSKSNVDSLSGARTMAGSPAYTAPELLKPKRVRDYGKAVDWWCLGILIYEMLFGKRPFHHMNVSVLYKLIEKDRVKFPSKASIPADVRDLIVGLLEKDPKKRLGARQASEILIHPFFRDVKWELVLRKKIQPPWTPIPISLEEERLRVSEIDFDKFLASQCNKSDSVFQMIFPWKSFKSRRGERRTMHTANDDFGKFSYVSDTTSSFLVNEDEILDSAFTGRRSVQYHALSSES